MTLQERKELLNDLMGEFQHIEEALKWGIENAYTIARVRTGDVMAFKLNEDDVVNLSLKPLVERFAKFIEDDDLIKRLKALYEERNHYAHVAFANFRWDADLFSCTSADDPRVAEINKRELDALKKVRKEVDAVVRDLRPHVRRLAVTSRALTNKS